MKTFILFCTAAFAVISNNAQGVFLRTFRTNDSIMLRWAPADEQVWRNAIKYGYVIERYTADQYFDLKGQDPSGKGILLTSSAIFPLSERDTNWNRLMIRPEIAIVWQALYGTHSSDPEKAMQEENISFGLSLKAADNSLTAARIQGLYYCDHTATKGENYFYLVRVNDPSTTNSGIAVCGERNSVLHSPTNLAGKFNNHSVVLSFDVSSTRQECSGYIIERSEDSLHFQRINKELLVFTRSSFEENKIILSYRDSFPENRRTYWYRVMQLSYFGIPGPASNVIHGKGMEEWNILAQIDTLYSIDNKVISIKWSLNQESPDLKKVILLHSTSANGTYKPINENIGGSSNTFQDKQATLSNYYIVCTISMNNDSGFSYPYFFPLKDDVPPGVPTNVHGWIDTSGLVHLEWSDVGDPDLKGYRVYRCNRINDEIIEVSHSILVTNSFADSITLNTLTRDIFYAVKSVDQMFNNSTLSSWYKLSRPDKIAPVPAIVIDIHHTDTTIVLQWRNTSSNDVMKRELVRDDDKSDLLIVSDQNDSICHYTDNKITPGTTYSYSVILTDSSGNISRTNFPSIIFSPRILPALQYFSATVDTVNRKLDLQWIGPQTTVERYVIYRSKKGEALRSWKTLSGGVTSVEDRTLYVSNTYVYAIKAIMKSGAETKMKVIEIEY